MIRLIIPRAICPIKAPIDDLRGSYVLEGFQKNLAIPNFSQSDTYSRIALFFLFLEESGIIKTLANLPTKMGKQKKDSETMIPVSSIILLDIPIRLIKQLLISVQLVLQQHPAQRLLHFPLAGDGLLPAIEADVAHDPVDIGYDLFDNGRGLGAWSPERVRSALDLALPFFFRFDILFGLQDFAAIASSCLRYSRLLISPCSSGSLIFELLPAR